MIKGWVKTTLIDFPGKIASILFLGGCNLRCPMCHNADLVLRPGTLADIPLDEILAYLQKNKGKITGVVVSGGEPCVNPGLIPLLSKFKEMGFAVKLDTNGFYPEILREILAQHLIDYAAIDIKAPPEKYALLCGLPSLNMDRFNQSLKFLIESKIDHEFRTTLVPNMITEKDVAAIARWLPHQSHYILQQFRPQGCLDPAYNELVPYPADVLRRMQAKAQETLSTVTIRGI
jgi:pyruvate formate lyase activating enzyme